MKLNNQMILTLECVSKANKEYTLAEQSREDFIVMTLQCNECEFVHPLRKPHPGFTFP
jgi:hypothetical protein